MTLDKATAPYRQVAGQKVDYIIVGAGSAGCVLANRLSADPRTQVLLIEAGPPDRHPFIHMPKGLGRTLKNPKLTWCFMSEPDMCTAGKAEAWVRGKMLGGSSAVNGMLYVRGQPQDYDHWQSLGAQGWGWQDIAPCFKAMEAHVLGANELRGADGPLSISMPSNKESVCEAAIAAGREMGLPVRNDSNGLDQEGVGYLQWTIGRGRRASAATAFLDPIRRRKNLRIVTDTLVERVLFEGTRAVGVRSRKGGAVQDFFAGREVILAAGAIQSPCLLQLSGVGPADYLKSIGVTVVGDNPNVGANLLEHRPFPLQYRLRNAMGYNREHRGWRLAFNGLRYYLNRSGIMAAGFHDTAAFFKSTPGAERADAQVLMTPFSLALNLIQGGEGVQFEREPGMQFLACQMRPESQGSIRIRSAAANATPIIKPNYLATQGDRRIAIDTFRYVRRLAQQEALKPYLCGETTPGRNIHSDDEIIDFINRDGLCGYHAVGTCRMGEDRGSVLDSKLRVRGVQALRVVDCSIMPTMVSGNTNGPTMALAWRASQLIAADAT
jgi:choline dehydrogenase-like flavoprotein